MRLILAFCGGTLLAIGFWSLLGWLALSDTPSVLLARTRISQSAAEAEAHQLLHSARKAVQESATDSARPLQVLAGDAHTPGCGLEPSALQGDHYLIANAVIPRGNGEFELLAIPYTSHYPVLSLRFRLMGQDEGKVVEVARPVHER